KEEARRYAEQAITANSFGNTSAKFGAFQAVERVDCDRIYADWIPTSNGPRAPMRSTGGRPVAHCSAKAKFERGDVLFDLWLDKNPGGWRIYQCKTTPG